MKFNLIITFLLFLPLLVYSQHYAHPLPSYTPSSKNVEYREKFRDMKYGLFIHWGIYSILGDGEWVMHQKKIPYYNYKQLADFFNPQQFNAKEWVDMAKSAGMKYITITSRHHDGFSMFKTEASKYNIVDATPYAKDPIKELAIECSRQGIELHLYYSLLDWGREDYGFGKPIIDGKPEGAEWASYISFMKKQLTELITNYPNVKAIWFDGHWERPNVNWHYNELYGLIHKLNPSILVGNNHHLAPFSGEDFQMFEKDLPGENKSGYSKNVEVSQLPLETCETINNSWGFNINDRKYKNVKEIIHYLVNAAGRNVNFLLNVGPMPNGKIQSEFKDTLKAVGDWLKTYGETIYGSRGGYIPPQSWGVVTTKNNVHFIHILNKPLQPYIFIPSLKRKISKAFLFKEGKSLRFKQLDEGVFVYLDNIDLNDIDTIIQLQ